MSDAVANQSIVVLINRDGMGETEDRELQQRLIKTYLSLLIDSGMLPAIICLYADGIKLVIEGSSVLDQFQELEAKGVHIVVCKTCLDHFQLADKLQVGVVGGMTDIIAAQWAASKVITV